MRVRGTQKEVKPIEVNVDTVYVRMNISRISDNDFEGWEYDEQTYSLAEYMEKLTSSVDSESMASLISILMNEIDSLQTRIESLEGANA